MANEFNIQVIQDGTRNLILKATGVLTASDLAQQVLIDPALTQGIDNTGNLKASALSIQRLIYVVEEGLAVNLWWDATTPVRIDDLVKAGHMEYREFGGLSNNAGVGKTGKILIGTQGWTVGTTLSFSVVMHLTKKQG
jgi:hypothetical protein